MSDHDPNVESDRSVPRRRPVQPQAALRPGRADPVVVLLLWVGRRSFWPLFIVGTAVAFGYGSLDEPSAATLTTPSDLVRALLSPLAGIAVAVLIRFAVGWLALVAAWPLSRWEPSAQKRSLLQIYRDGVDRLRLAQAYRSLRWTWAVRAEAIQRAGRLGTRLGWAVPLSTILSVLAVVALVVVVSARPPAT